ncbi:uncharacterized protein LOC124386876 [Silurus meridionalis]|uniref:uncharacterized protein LOC124386876 n=1 Tax=Silurus meridionalis TaxID=175797 RepID=UPI001EEC9416|nr:uncharacterized protein LOC124386876 [Silurus meridionalis]
MEEKEMKRRTMKRKASVINDVPIKRCCPWNGCVTKWKKPPNLGSTTLLMLIIGHHRSYMKEASGLYQFINTCVPDSLLALFHILFIKHLHIRALLVSNYFFKVLMDTLNEGKYTYARALWIKQLDDSYKRDRYSTIKQHFPIIDKLVCAKVDYHQETPEDHPIYKKTLGKFRPFGDLRALGDKEDPSIILVHRDVHNPRYDPCLRYNLPVAVADDNKRYLYKFIKKNIILLMWGLLTKLYGIVNCKNIIG